MFSTFSAMVENTGLVCSPIHDDHTNTAISLCSYPDWWRGLRMTVSVDATVAQGHMLVLRRKIDDEASWPEVLVIYQDGNIRLKPHPPSGVLDVCYGSSVILGPAAPDPVRPFVDIAIQGTDLETTLMPRPWSHVLR